MAAEVKYACLECPICNLPYSENVAQLVPVSLYCGHHLCRDCANKLWARGRSAYITCPYCRRTMSVRDANALPRCFAIQSLIREIAEENGGAPGPAPAPSPNPLAHLPRPIPQPQNQAIGDIHVDVQVAPVAPVAPAPPAPPPVNRTGVIFAPRYLAQGAPAPVRGIFFPVATGLQDMAHNQDMAGPPVPDELIRLATLLDAMEHRNNARNMQ